MGDAAAPVIRRCFERSRRHYDLRFSSAAAGGLAFADRRKPQPVLRRDAVAQPLGMRKSQDLARGPSAKMAPVAVAMRPIAPMRAAGLRCPRRRVLSTGLATDVVGPFRCA